MSRRYRSLHFVLLAFLSFPFAKDAFASMDVVKIEGQATVRKSKDAPATPLQEGAKVIPGDLIEVGTSSRLLLGDAHSQFWLGSRASITLSEGGPVANGEGSKKVFSVLTGNLRAKIKTGEGQRFEVRSRSAVAGVRGTEFFFSNDEETVTFCVLEGKAWLKDETSGKEFDVKEGAGVVLKPDGSATRTFTPEQVKVDWVAMTAFEDERRLTSVFYRPEPQPKPLGDLWSYRNVLVGMARPYWNKDYDDATPNTNEGMYHLYYSPTLILNQPLSLQITPRFYALKSDRADVYTIWDDVPPTSKLKQQGVYLQEAFTKYQGSNWQVRAGFFELNWKENALIMPRLYMHESVSHLGVHGIYTLGLNDTDINIEALWTDKANTTELRFMDGRTNIGITALRFTEAKDRYSLTLLTRDSGQLENKKSLFYKSGTFVREAIVAARDTREYFDYNASVGYQKVEAYRGADPSRLKKVEALSYDLALGIPLPMQFRTQARYVYAGPNHVPGLEDYYELGFLGRWMHTNMRQKRILLEKSFGDRDRVRLEYLTSRAAGNSIFQSWQIAGLPPVSGRSLAGEIDLMWIANWTPELQTFTSAWYFDTGEMFTKRDPAWGGNIGFRWAY